MEKIAPLYVKAIVKMAATRKTEHAMMDVILDGTLMAAIKVR